ncbi:MULTISPECIES: Rad52/Rad22 family DNA repair protein [unclassified Nocardia]|uniref:Rad52/Rad22 family DNA repair protein n=1 Tax=unclassified Nocardia TaxID=2637762 RepID=UPI00278C26B3|nr:MULTISPECIES: Rad52/Rad22 family DNA repair protein [unclassified Nocardia]
MPFTAHQVEQLLRPINVNRIARDDKQKSYLPQQDVLAHLVRTFGFGHFDFELLSLEFVFEQQHVTKDGKEPRGRFDVCYRAVMRLTVRDPDGNPVCRYEDGSCGDASNLTRADAHDLAMKAAISTAKKRCAIALGDQFGLSLYNKGQTDALVRVTLVNSPNQGEGDVQDGVPQSVGTGIDETDRDQHGTPVDVDAITAQLHDEITDAVEVTTLRVLWKQAGGLPETQMNLLRALAEARMKSLRAEQDGVDEATVDAVVAAASDDSEGRQSA